MRTKLSIEQSNLAVAYRLTKDARIKREIIKRLYFLNYDFMKRASYKCKIRTTDSRDDLMQTFVFWLIRALERYDGSKGFLTYFAFYIRGAINEFRRTNQLIDGTSRTDFKTKNKKWFNAEISSLNAPRKDISNNEYGEEIEYIKSDQIPDFEFNILPIIDNLLTTQQQMAIRQWLRNKEICAPHKNTDIFNYGSKICYSASLYSAKARLRKLSRNQKLFG